MRSACWVLLRSPQGVAPGHQLVEATLNGWPGLFVLDTGANVTVVGPSQAERFGLASSRDGPLARRERPASGNASQISIKSLEIGSITIRQTRVVTADLSRLLPALSRASGEDILG